MVVALFVFLSGSHPGLGAVERLLYPMAESDYKTYTEIEHVLERPQMYLGRREVTACQGPTFEWTSETTLVPTAYSVTTSPLPEKLLDEVMANSMDASLEDATVKNISVSVNAETGEIVVYNDGTGIPVRPLSATDRTLVPTVIFSQPRSSSKFDDTKESLTGGMNGFGIKLANIWSSRFTVKTFHPGSRREFEQTWSNNMRDTEGPKTRVCGNKRGWVEVRFVPDFERIGIQLPLSPGVLAMLHARVFDACACTHARVRVQLDGRVVPIKGPAQYAALTFSPSKVLAHDLVAIDGVDRLDVTVVDSGAERSMWFVNGLRTRGGGTLLEYVVRKVGEILTAKVREKSKNQSLSVRPSLIKEHLGIVAVARIPNARFTSQEKDVLESPVSKFGFQWTPSKSFVQGVERSELVDRALQAHVATDERKSKTAVRRTTLPSKLDPALLAGKRGSACTLILTEGDSAKATVVAAIDVIGREKYGIFPLRGKVINGMANAATKLLENEEVKNMLAILHIDPFKKTWSEGEINALPYSNGVLIVADADVDGTHICGLVVCLLHRLCPDILRQRPNFVRKFASPILQAHHNGVTHSFLTDHAFRVWRDAQPDDVLRRVRIDYFKGLGTWSSADARRFFAQFKEHTLSLCYSGSTCDDTLRLFFDPEKTDARKSMLTDCDFSTFHLDYTRDDCSIQEFLEQEHIHFSAEDIVRSIPRIDGFKPGARKVMWAFRKRNFRNKIKVAQAGAAVAEISQYHHGETSLIETICNLSQTHVGTNNLNLLIPKGQFGSRANNRTTHAAPRYIFCRLSPLFDALCPSADDPVLPHDTVDGVIVEPVQYAPVVALPLLNGIFGIGTGFSTSVPNYRPEDVIAATKAYIHEGEAALRASPLLPWYRGFYGTVQEVADKPGTYELNGKFEVQGDTITITELPPGKWTSDYREYLKRTFVDTGIAVKLPLDRSTEHSVCIDIVCDPAALSANRDKLEKMLKLTTVERITNMWLWNSDGKLEKFATPHDIIIACAAHRLSVYDARRTHLVAALTDEIAVLENKLRFITEERSGEVQTQVADEDAIVAQLVERHYLARTQEPVAPMTETALRDNEGAEDDGKEEPGDEPADDGDERTTVQLLGARAYDYLLDMKIRQKTDKSVEAMRASLERLRVSLETIRTMVSTDMWLAEMCEFERRLSMQGVVRDEEGEGHSRKRPRASSVPGPSKQAR
jgi:DNA topoisomerase II